MQAELIKLGLGREYLKVDSCTLLVIRILFPLVAVQFCISFANSSVLVLSIVNMVHQVSVVEDISKVAIFRHS
jgi:hypothetical protein